MRRRVALFAAGLVALLGACEQAPPPPAPPPPALPGPQTGVIEGQVLLVDSDSHRGTLVYCAGTNHVAFTDEAGRFAFSDLPFGDYDLFARHEGYSETGLGQASLSPRAPRVALDPQTLNRTPLEVLSLPPPERGSLSGRASRADVPQRAGITVSVEGTSLRTVTDEGGHWLLHEIEPGDHQIRFTAEGYHAVTATARVEPGLLVEIPPAVLEPVAQPQETTRGVHGFVALLSADGRLEDDYTGVRILLNGADSGVTPDAQGHFEIRGLAPGVYGISAQAPNHRPADIQTVDLRAAMWREVTLFLENEGVARPPTGTVEGRVELADGAPPVGVAVGIPGTSQTAITGPDGRFRLASVPAGEVTLIAQASGHETLERTGIRVAAGQTTDVGTLRLQPHREPPRVIATDPADGERDVLLEPEVPVFIRFSEPMDIGSVRAALRLEPEVAHEFHVGREHPETDYDLALLMLRGGGERGLDFRQRVSVTVGTEARSAAGVPMAEPFELRFTMGRPSLYASNPRDGAEGFPPQQPITLRFNAALRTEEIDTAFSFSPDPPTLPNVQWRREPGTGWTTVLLSSTLAPNQRYTLRIGSRLRTESGQRLAGRREITFRTAPQMVIDFYGEPAERDDSVIY